MFKFGAVIEDMQITPEHGASCSHYYFNVICF